jgi:hypothetical protein
VLAEPKGAVELLPVEEELPAELDLASDLELPALGGSGDELEPAVLPEALAGIATAEPVKKKRKRRDPIEELRKRRARERRKLLLAAGEDVDARPKKKKRKKRRTDEAVRPSPPLQQTDPMKHYLAGEMVPCPVGCGAFSEVVRISTRENGAGEVWFECLSCAQRRAFEVPAATPKDLQQIRAQTEAGQEAHCLRHGDRVVGLRRRGMAYVCPECGVAYDMS